jgi:hypothetical protein
MPLHPPGEPPPLLSSLYPLLFSEFVFEYDGEPVAIFF